MSNVTINMLLSEKSVYMHLSYRSKILIVDNTENPFKINKVKLFNLATMLPSEEFLAHD